NQSEQLPGSAAMNKDVSAESGVLRRLRLGADGADDRLMLGLCDQSLFQPFVGVGDVGVADAQREVEFASRVFVRDVVIAFGRRAVALPPFSAGWVITERNLVGLYHSLLPVFQTVKVKLALGFFDEYVVSLFRIAVLLRLTTLLSPLSE